MSEPSKLGVTQTGIGLTLLTCLLAALGYIALQRLGDSSDSPPVADSPATPNETYQSSGTGSPNANAGQQSPPINGGESPVISYPQTTLRPIWVAPQQDTDDTRLHRFDPNASVEDVEGSSLFNSQPIDLPPSTDEPTRY